MATLVSGGLTIIRLTIRETVCDELFMPDMVHTEEDVGADRTIRGDKHGAECLMTV